MYQHPEQTGYITAAVREGVCSQVADALDDQCCQAWLTVAAGILHRAALAHSTSGKRGPQHTSNPLETLPHHLQARVIEAAAHAAGDSCLAVLLNYLPSHLHAAVLAANITPNKALKTPRNTNLLSVTEALVLLPASLHSLHLESEMPSTTTPGPKQHAAAAAAAALRHHTSLTSLCIPSFYGELSIAEAVASLVSLQALQLGSHRHALDTVPLLKATLPSLPRLQDLKLSLSEPADRHLSQQHGRSHDGSHREVPSEAPQRCLASLISLATALTSLDIDEPRGPMRLVATAPLSLPCLRQLSVTSHAHNTAYELIRQLSAPLATLCINNRSASPWQLPQVHRATQLLVSLIRFVHLESLTIDLDVEWATDEARRACASTVPPAIAALTRMQELSITAGLPLTLRTAQHMAVRAAAVQRLRFRCDPPDVDSSMPGESEAAWSLIITHLSRLRLRHLDIQTRWSPLEVQPPGISMLQPLTQLTALHLRGWRSCLECVEDCAALAGMQELRSVFFEGFVVPPGAGAAYVAALGALPNLAQLALAPDRDVRAPLTEFVEHAAAAAWPALQWLGLAGCSESAEAVVRAVHAFPALRHLTMCDAPRGRLGGEEPDRTRVIGLASDAGIALAFGRDWERFAWRSAWR